MIKSPAESIASVQSRARPKAHEASRSFAERYVGAGRLRGQVALITGGESGIGRAVALAFAKEGRRRGDRLHRTAR